MTEDRLQTGVSPGSAGEVIAAIALPLDPTGVPNLDFVLGGGLRRGSLMLLVGPPGGGKSTLAAQMAFAAAAAGRRALILTALSEPVGKLLAHLRASRFYDEALVGERLRIHSLQQFLPQGLASTGREVAAIVRAEGAGLVVIDGFSGLRTADGPQAVRRFLYDLGTALSLQGATTVITSEGRAHDPALFGETTTADVIVSVETSRDNVRTTRWIEVVKARGTSPLAGLHGLTIGPEGVTVRPRLEARVAPAVRDVAPTTPTTDPAAAPPLSFGQPGLDAILAGGVTRDTTTLVVGGPSTGKTLLGLHFALAGVAAGEPTVYLSLRESRRQLLRKCDPFDLGPALRAALTPGGGLTLLRRPAVELDSELLADDLVAAIDRVGARRLVLDSIDEWERAVGEGSDPRRIPNHLAALVAVLHARAVTALIVREGYRLGITGAEFPDDALTPLAENVIALGVVVNKGRAHRVLSLPKQRFAPQDPARHEVVIAPPDGLRVLGAFRSDAGVLEALAEEEAGERDRRGADKTPPGAPEPENGRDGS